MNEADLGGLGSPDEGVAQRAFERLMSGSAPLVRGFLANKCCPPEVVNDLQQEVGIRVWKRRRAFEPKGTAAWQSFVTTVARNCLVDYIRENPNTLSIDDELLPEPTDADAPLLDSVVELSEERASLYDLADELWLGVHQELSPREKTRRTLAAQMFLMDGLPWQQVCRFLNQQGNRLDRRTFDAWMSEPSTVRLLAFHELYVDNGALAKSILGLAEDADLSALYRRSKQESAEEAPPGFTWAEVTVVILRYRVAMKLNDIVRIEGHRISEKEIAALLVRCREQFPFLKKMESLVEGLKRSSLKSELLAAKSLWQRLAFQYYCADALPHKDIHERIGKPAERVGANITEGSLNAWLSNERILTRLVEYGKRRTA